MKYNEITKNTKTYNRQFGAIAALAKLKEHRNLIIMLIIIFVLNFTLIACKTKKEILQTKGTNNNQIKNYIKVEKLYENILENEINYQNINIKMSVEVQINEQKQDFSAIVRIQKDSIIWISFRKLNLEGFRICITQDSVKFIDRMNNKYYSENYEIFAANIGLDLDYKAFQSILTNSFFFYPCSNEANLINNFKLCLDEENYCISSLSKIQASKYFNNKINSEIRTQNFEKENQNNSNNQNNDSCIFQRIKIIPNSFKIANIFLENKFDQQSVFIEYQNFINKQNKNYPEKIKLNLSTNQIEIIAELKITDISFNTNNISFPFKISNNLEKLKINWK